jgi:tRNA pseudouridine38-40 synthase
MNPLLRGRAWHVPRKLDFAKMRTAAKLFVGRHDFKSFAATHSYEMDSTIRTLTRCSLKRSGANVEFIIDYKNFH